MSSRKDEERSTQSNVSIRQIRRKLDRNQIDRSTIDPFNATNVIDEFVQKYEVKEMERKEAERIAEEKRLKEEEKHRIELELHAADMRKKMKMNTAVTSKLWRHNPAFRQFTEESKQLALLDRATTREERLYSEFMEKESKRPSGNSTTRSNI
ncbi:hypothetical protein SNEBB_002468 [Seison nebaliae]|nr:hypothetical protein SNEBB_002468 [Seison nebaliae]